MNLAALKTELTSDPLQIGYAAMGDVAAAESLNALSRPGRKPLGSRTLLSWGAANSRLAKVADAAAKTGDFAGINSAFRSVAMAADLLLKRADTELDLSLATHQQLVGALVAAGVLTESDSDELYALAATQISRAVELGLGVVTPSDVADARRPE
jgi:hypothetical protein